MWLVFGFIFTFLAEGLVFLLWEAVENRKGAVKPRPLCTPLGLFLGVLGCGGVRLLTCVCMLRCWMCEVEPMYVDADGEASCCRLVEDFFIFCLRRGGGYMYS